MIALFDNEEVGSASVMGAGGPVMVDAMKRVTDAIAAAEAAPGSEMVSCTTSSEIHVQSAQSSFLVSADMAHALHPNYVDKHDPQLRPELGAGMGYQA